jgi:hypothetical protein
MWQNGKVSFPSHNIFVHKHIFPMLTKIIERYVLLAFGDYAIVAITIDL